MRRNDQCNALRLMTFQSNFKVFPELAYYFIHLSK